MKKSFDDDCISLRILTNVYRLRAYDYVKRCFLLYRSSD